MDEVGDRATVVAGTGTYSTEHSVHLTARAHELGVHGVPRGDAVLQQASRARDRRALPGDRGRVRPADRRLQHPGARRPQPRDRRDRAARRDPDRAGREAGERRPRPGAPRSSSSGSTSTRGTTTSCCPFLEVGGRGGVCVHTHVVGPQVKEMVRRFRAGDVEGARALDEELAAVDRPPAGRREPDRDQVRAEPARARGRRSPAPARRGERRGARRRPRLPRAPRPASAGGCIVPRSRELLAALMEAHAGGLLAQPPGLGGEPGLGIAGISGARGDARGMRSRRLDARTSSATR